MNKLVSLMVAGAMAAASSVAVAGDAAAGKALYAKCQACHGANGISANPMWPNLAGQKDKYVIKQLKAFRDGTRKDPMMAPMAKPLSDADIENLAAYIAGLK